MGGQVLGGGVIVLVAVALWLVYLLPSWYSRHQYDSAQRNAVRLNQALRVLAETSETPEEVRLELNARTVAAQHKLARKAQQELVRTERERADAERAAAQARAQVETAEAAARARAEVAAARRHPEVRRSRARRRVRLFFLVTGCLGLALAAGGGFLVWAGESMVPLWAGSALALLCAVALVKIARVSARSARRPAMEWTVVRPRAQLQAQDISLADERAWQPRELPRPLTASAGSRAAAVVAGAAERDRLRQVALDASLHERAAQARPPRLDAARLARAGRQLDDAAIEAHVRELLARRAAG